MQGRSLRRPGCQASSSLAAAMKRVLVISQIGQYICSRILGKVGAPGLWCSAGISPIHQISRWPRKYSKNFPVWVITRTPFASTGISMIWVDPDCLDQAHALVKRVPEHIPASRAGTGWRTHDGAGGMAPAASTRIPDRLKHVQGPTRFSLENPARHASKIQIIHVLYAHIYL